MVPRQLMTPPLHFGGGFRRSASANEFHAAVTAHIRNTRSQVGRSPVAVLSNWSSP